MSGAVFLSYAREDSEAAQRIAEALRGRGVEVWFDQSELRGGDSWDAKIKQQIKECALFVPLISAQTNARAEGYFRLEWKLAVDRSHLVADDTPFILPVVVDDTAEAAARVPDRFREVQWTRIRLSESPAEFAGRAASLLAGEPVAAPRAGALGPTRRPTGGLPRRGIPGWAIVAILVAGIGAGLYFSRHRSRIVPGAEAPAVSPAASEAQQLAERARVYYYAVEFTPADLGVAEDLARRATESDPNLAFAWGVRAGVQAAYIQRSWNFDEAFGRDAEAFAKRALAIDPDETQALLAMGYFLDSQGAFEQAEAYLRRALSRAPDDNRIRRQLAVDIWNSGRIDEGLAVLKKAVERDPRDVLAHYDLALLNIDGSKRSIEKAEVNLPAALLNINAALAVQPMNGAWIPKGRLIAMMYGDVAGMRACLDRISPEGRTEIRSIYFTMYCGLLARDLDSVLSASALTSKDYFEDWVIAQPKAFSLALAYGSAGKENLARQQWETAEAVLRKRIQDNPDQDFYRAELAMTLAWLGRSEEASRVMAPLEAAWREQMSSLLAMRLALYYAAEGDAPRAVSYIILTKKRTSRTTPWILKLDPWWDKLRGKPEFDHLLAASVFPTEPK
jgi:tetratricopeptide (TPR) repeat protein